jgi:hypothetical protein
MQTAPASVAPWSPPADLVPAIYYDLFPSTVTFPISGSVYDKARIIITAPPSPRLYVFTDTNQGPGAAVIAEYDIDRIYGNTKQGFDLVLTAPNPTPVHVQIRPLGNCGCGSRLKSFRPFTNLRHTAAPDPAGTIADYAEGWGNPLP